ncbi:NAD(P)-binding protein [Daedalea quercina L-15889]|uniref:NAD(P)-binding protein n=1 Tax=Daedalea quercina L-15889 TaxID=1314783 RepID=A0A165PJ60_9APHY|nr:NAD(P)-binding protein [Daedalea quercina L-15889]
MSSQIWFITGSSSGFGRLVLENVLESGGSAIATLRNPDALSDLASRYPPEKLIIVRLDVSKSDEICEAFAKAKQHFGRIDVVFNNAGFTLLSEAESAPEDVARSVLDVNFWGAANVSREAVKFFREVNNPQGGRLLQSSSEGGIEGYSALPYYCASKFALEGFTEGLAAELRPEWNTKITLIVLGAYHGTNNGRNMKRPPPHPAYIDARTQQPIARLHLYTKSAAYSDEAARLIVKAAELPDPPLRLPIGQDALEALRRKGRSLLETAEEYQSWSENVTPISFEEFYSKLNQETAKTN